MQAIIVHDTIAGMTCKGTDKPNQMFGPNQKENVFDTINHL